MCLCSEGRGARRSVWIGFAIDARMRWADREAIVMWVIIATIAVNIGFARNLPARAPVRAPNPAVN